MHCEGTIAAQMFSILNASALWKACDASQHTQWQPNSTVKDIYTQIQCLYMTRASRDATHWMTTTYHHRDVLYINTCIQSSSTNTIMHQSMTAYCSHIFFHKFSIELLLQSVLKAKIQNCKSCNLHKLFMHYMLSRDIHIIMNADVQHCYSQPMFHHHTLSHWSLENILKYTMISLLVGMFWTSTLDLIIIASTTFKWRKLWTNFGAV